MLDDDELKPGDRICLTELARSKMPRTKSTTGVVRSVIGNGAKYTVVLDGNASYMTLHRSYIRISCLSI